jgi:hypothetical protein
MTTPRAFSIAAPLAFALTLWNAAPAAASNCAGTSVGFTALTDLGAGLYRGFPGGLYPGGLDQRPAAHEQAGLAIASTIVPLDTLGQPSPGGRVVIISIGMSNCTQEFSAFVPRVRSDPLREAHVVAIDCAQGGQATQLIRQSAAPYWDTVATRLRGHGSSPLQAQVVWLKEARSGPTEGFPAAAESLSRDLGTIVRLIHAKLPNVKAVYFTSRIYAGYASTTLNPEPYAYESGFAVKWLIESQIAGVDSLNFDPAAGPVEAPWLSWGPYLWADGLAGRADGLIWRCTEFQSDGTHPADTARVVVADSLLAFFRNDDTTAPWYRAHPLGASRPDDATLELSAAPLPAYRGSAVTIRFRPSGAWRLELYDASGRVIRRYAGASAAAALALRWDQRDREGRSAPPGLYAVRLTSGGHVARGRVVLLAQP